MCLLTTKTARHQNMTHIQTKSRETGGRVGKKGTTFAHLCYSQCRICLLNRVETPFHRVCLCVRVCISELRLLSRSVSMLVGHQTQ